jgi:hypothetical protein
MREITREELLSYRTLTVGDLKKFIEEYKLSDDALIVVEIVDDKYFNGGCDISGCSSIKDDELVVLPEGTRSSEWGVYLKNGEHSHSLESYNEKLKDKENYPDLSGEPISQEEINKAKVRYHPVWSPVGYKINGEVEKDILYLDLHY